MYDILAKTRCRMTTIVGSIPAQMTQLQACAELRTRGRPRLTI